MVNKITTLDDYLGELMKRQKNLGHIAAQCGCTRQYARWVIIQRLAGVPPAPHTKGGKVLAAIDAALLEPTQQRLPVSIGQEI